MQDIGMIYFFLA